MPNEGELVQAKYRLKKNFQYNYVYKHAKTVSDGNLVILYCNSNNQQSKVGFSVGKRQGNAVKRNRLRRQLKAAMRQFMPNVKPRYNIVVVPRRSTPYLYSDILISVNQLLNKAGLLQ